MRRLRYSINVTLDGCVDHMAADPHEDVHRLAVADISACDLLFGRVIYEMMQGAWRVPSPTMPAWMLPFATTIGAAKKHVVSSTLKDVDWNAELVRGDLGTAVRALKAMPGKDLFTGGVQLPTALLQLGLIDEVQLVVHPHVVGHGPWLFTGLTSRVGLQLIERRELASGLRVERYEPRRAA